MIQSAIKRRLPGIARRFPSNRSPSRQAYPQLWWCLPRRPRILLRLLQWLCGQLTGHEPSETEWGYGGGKFVDRNCRWCDKVIRIPLAESPPPNDILRALVAGGFQVDPDTGKPMPKNE